MTATVTIADDGTPSVNLEPGDIVAEINRLDPRLVALAVANLRGNALADQLRAELDQADDDVP